MKKIIVILLALALVGGAGFYLWQNREQYFFQGEEDFEVDDDDQEAERILREQGDLEDEVVSGDEEDEEDDPDEFENEENDYQTPVVNDEDCDNRCGDFSGDEKEYCEEICGFAEDNPDREADDCESLEKLNRDACFKQKAVNEQDASICQKISDPELEENCERRVLEEVLK